MWVSAFREHHALPPPESYFCSFLAGSWPSTPTSVWADLAGAEAPRGHTWGRPRPPPLCDSMMGT